VKKVINPPLKAKPVVTILNQIYEVDVASGVVLIALLLFIGSHFNSWAERLFDPVFDHWVWHEPLDDWNL
jgi:hypothetical protein